MSTKKRGAPKKEVTASKRLNGRVTAEFHNLLKQLAKKEEISMTEVIVKAVNEYHKKA